VTPPDDDASVPVPRAPGPRPALGPLLRERADLVVLVAVGGALGSLLRWAVSTALPVPATSPSWPTVLVNLSGAAALAALLVWLTARRPGSRRAQPLLGTGLLGGWTTFSAAVLDVQAHLVAGRLPALALAVGVGLLAPVLAAWLATAVTRSLVGAPGTAR
jgi:CrcB protein